MSDYSSTDHTSGNAGLDHFRQLRVNRFHSLSFFHIYIAKATYLPRAISNVSSFIKHIAGNLFHLCSQRISTLMIGVGGDAYTVFMSCQSPSLDLSTVRTGKMFSLYLFLFSTWHGAVTKGLTPSF